MKKKALVTGASRGIGKAVATKLAAEGYDLVLTCAQNIEKLQDIAIDLKGQHNIKCSVYKVDAKDAKQVENLFETEKNLDVVINNAGISHIGLLQDMSVEEWGDVIGTNLSSAFYTSKYAIPYMISQKNGVIINISSVWGVSGASMEVAYSASKGGINSFTKALAKELAPSNIRVNAIACGVVDTDMNRCFNDEERAVLEDEIPMGRFAQPEEIADAVSMIINGPSYMTGQIIVVDGGFI